MSCLQPPWLLAVPELRWLDCNLITVTLNRVLFSLISYSIFLSLSCSSQCAPLSGAWFTGCLSPPPAVGGSHHHAPRRHLNPLLPSGLLVTFLPTSFHVRWLPIPHAIASPSSNPVDIVRGIHPLAPACELLVFPECSHHRPTR